jgi:hypothetical protein
MRVFVPTTDMAKAMSLFGDNLQDRSTLRHYWLVAPGKGSSHTRLGTLVTDDSKYLYTLPRSKGNK